MLGNLIPYLKELLSLDPNQRSMMFSWLFCGVIIYYLYDSNNSLTTKLEEHEKSCQVTINKSRESCEEQIRVNRENSQKQITSFIEKSNAERDSIYNYFYKEIRKSNNIVTKSMNNLNSLKNENSN